MCFRLEVGQTDLHELHELHEDLMRVSQATYGGQSGGLA